MNKLVKTKTKSKYVPEHTGSIKRTLSSLTLPVLARISSRTGMFGFFYLSTFILFSCNSNTDIKYNEMNSRLFYMKMGYQTAISWFNNTLDRQMDITQGRKFIHKDDENLTPSEIEKLNSGITYVEFTPSDKEIADAIHMINKINSVKPLILKTDSICRHAILFYYAGKKIDRPNQIVKHQKSDYGIMDRDFEEIKKLDKEIRAILEMPLSAFLIQNDREIKYDSVKDSAFFFLIYPPIQ